jgi:hypothetical protein
LISTVGIEMAICNLNRNVTGTYFGEKCFKILILILTSGTGIGIPMSESKFRLRNRNSDSKIKTEIEIPILTSTVNFDEIRIKFRRNFDFVESKKMTFVETLLLLKFWPHILT